MIVEEMNMELEKYRLYSVEKKVVYNYANGRDDETMVAQEIEMYEV